MRYFSIILGILIAVPFVYPSTSSTGTVQLNEFTFSKIIDKFDVSLVKFDVAYPYGPKHDEYVALGKELRDVDEVLIAEVGVKDYGEKDNEALAKKYGATKETFPVVKLFIKDKKEPVHFDDSDGFTTDKLRVFIREKTGLYLSLPGCVKDLDLLAIKFMKSKKEDRKDVLKEAEVVLKKLKDKDANSGKIYKKIMEKTIEKGDEFVASEYERTKKLQNGKISNEKKNELQIKMNILQTFLLHNKQDRNKEEL